MADTIENVLRIQVDPRPDPLHTRSGPAWAGFVPAAVTAILCVIAVLALSTHDLGLVACGAGVWAVASSALRGSFCEFCLRFHVAAGLFALALFRGAEGAGEFAPAAAAVRAIEFVTARQYFPYQPVRLIGDRVRLDEVAANRANFLAL